MDNDMLRTIYVGITRAKQQLYIYKDTSFLNDCPSIVIPLTMRDVWLDFFRDKKKLILSLRSGDRLTYRNNLLFSAKGECIAVLSMGMKERIKQLQAKGFQVKEAEASYIIAWRPQEKKEEVAVCLANLVLERR